MKRGLPAMLVQLKMLQGCLLQREENAGRREEGGGEWGSSSGDLSGGGLSAFWVSTPNGQCAARVRGVMSLTTECLLCAEHVVETIFLGNDSH